MYINIDYKRQKKPIIKEKFIFQTTKKFQTSKKAFLLLILLFSILKIITISYITSLAPFK